MTRRALCQKAVPTILGHEVALPIRMLRLGVTYDWWIRHKTTILKQSSQIWIPRKQGLEFHGPYLPPASLSGPHLSRAGSAPQRQQQ